MAHIQNHKMAKPDEFNISFSIYITTEQIKVRIIDKFLFVEATSTEGKKGVDFTKMTFKTCKKLSPATDTQRIRAFYDGETIKIGVKRYRGIEILIDKRQARRPAKKKPFFTPKNNTNYNDFVKAMHVMGFPSFI